MNLTAEGVGMPAALIAAEEMIAELLEELACRCPRHPCLAFSELSMVYHTSFVVSGLWPVLDQQRLLVQGFTIFSNAPQQSLDGQLDRSAASACQLQWEDTAKEGGE